MNEKNKKEGDSGESILLTILEESFRHWRHIENLRQGFTAVWAAIVAGVLTFTSQITNFFGNTASIPTLIFLILITLLGFLMSIRLSNNIKPCEYNIREILKSTKLDMYDMTRPWGKGITKHFRLRRIFIFAYFAALIFLSSLVILIFAGFWRQN